MENIKINVYGDSVMKGVVIDESYKYRATMEDKLKSFRELFNIEFKNRSKFGITVEKGKQLLEKDLEASPDFDYALVEFGGNDCNFRWNEISENPLGPHRPLTAIDCFKETYLNMVNQLKKRSVQPILMTLPPIDAERYFNFITMNGNDCKKILSWLGDVNMIYRFHELYSNAITEVAEKTGSLILDVRSRFLGKFNFKELIGLDGIHPSNEGYNLIVNVLREFASGLPGYNRLITSNA